MTIPHNKNIPLDQPPTESYPGGAYVSHVQVIRAEAGRLKAFIADKPVVDAGVAIVLSQEVEEQLEEKKYRRYLCFRCILLILIGVATVVAVFLIADAPPIPTEVAISVAPSDFPSFSPTMERFEEFLAKASSISGVAFLTDKMSPQYKAALWVANDDELDLPLEDPRVIQRYVLAVFYFSMNGDKWEHCGRRDPTCGGDPRWRTWLVGKDSECTWRGVDCDPSGNVNRIFFKLYRGNGLKGQIPHEISKLKDLAGLMLQGNSISGTFPSFFAEMPKLRILFLQRNEFTGTLSGEHMLKMTALEILHLNSNQLNGTIPEEIGLMPRLSHMRLNNNAFVGPIPPLLNFDFVQIAENRLTGSLPELFYNNRNLSNFYANNNLLTGTLSSRIGDMVSLVNLRLGGNRRLGGTLPRELFDLPKITQINITSCNFTGTLSEEIEKMSGTIGQLILENNKFFGPLPEALNTLKGNLRELTLHQNDFTGTIASSDTLCKLRGDSIHELSNLAADCGAGQVKVTCDCCTHCYP